MSNKKKQIMEIIYTADVQSHQLIATFFSVFLRLFLFFCFFLTNDGAYFSLKDVNNEFSLAGESVYPYILMKITSKYFWDIRQRMSVSDR
jgi:hypothetical protein